MAPMNAHALVDSEDARNELRDKIPKIATFKNDLSVEVYPMIDPAEILKREQLRGFVEIPSWVVEQCRQDSQGSEVGVWELTSREHPYVFR